MEQSRHPSNTSNEAGAAATSPAPQITENEINSSSPTPSGAPEMMSPKKRESTEHIVTQPQQPQPQPQLQQPQIVIQPDPELLTRLGGEKKERGKI